MVDSKAPFSPRDFMQVTPELATSGSLSSEELRHIASAGFRTIVNLLPDHSQYALPDEEAIVTSLGMKYIHVPVEFETPTIENFEDFRSAMSLDAESPIWVHCAANKRVSVFVSMYGQIELGWSPAQATKLIEQIWEPTAVWSSLSKDILSSAVGAK